MLKDLLRTRDLSGDDIVRLLDLSAAYKAEPLRHHDTLRGETVVQFFGKPSTRTRISFETAIARLGGSAITTGPNDLQLGRGETIEDTARTISQYARAFVIRTFKDDDVRRFAAAAAIPVVNALTDGHHPCQSLADLLTLRERFGDVTECRLAYVGDGYNVANSLLEAAALLGMDIAVATPPGYEPDRASIAFATAEAERSGARHHHERPGRGRARGARRLHRRMVLDGRYRARARLAHRHLSALPRRPGADGARPARRRVHALPPGPPRRGGHGRRHRRPPIRRLPPGRQSPPHGPGGLVRAGDGRIDGA